MRVLIGIPSPRDIPEFIKAMSWIKDDQLWIKYYDEYTAYRYMRRFFLKYKKYTHLCIIPDDLLMIKEQYDRLKEEVRQQDYLVFSGTCNLDWDRRGILACKQNGEWMAAIDKGIQQVEFEGFACCFIRRDVVEKIVLDGQSSFDKVFAERCKELAIPLYVDTAVRMLHLSNRSKLGYENMGIGLFVPQIAVSRHDRS